MTSPLVAPVTGSTTGITGLGLVEDAHGLVTGIQNGSWIDASLGGVGTSLEALSLVLDPIGGLVSWGVGWLMEHVSVLKEALDNLAGNADEVAAHATTWQNVAAYTQAARADYAARLSADVSTWAGDAGDAYRAHAGDHLAALDGIGVAAGGIASAVEGTGLLVALVREIVRDLIADFVATLAVRLPQWLAAEGLTLGIATPFVASQVSSLVAKWAHRIQHFIRGLLSSLRQLLPKTDGLKRILEKLRELLARLARKSPFSGRAEASTGGTGAGGKPSAGGAPGGSPGFTTPSGPPDPNLRPRGTRTEAHPERLNDRGVRRENESADVLAQHGYDIEQNPEKKANGKEPDYKIEGEYFDCYSPASDNAEKIRNKLSKKVREEQADRLILFMDDTPRTMEEVAAVLQRKPIANLKEILVVQDGEVIPFYPFGE
ncbi:hypothetical protein AMIS_58920 [Actinoplanes missouriensis 431]|uniref:tRNA nuclease CdiA C-terminal domain-containing protein n=1 Tax=Actinoplanes missouriensis (strain ATCC 14538 / DSM 43046 / CBS 188.64 / JCM 3121 / NBRC 102363 / NCIMB 12654 / NRRL B-3342 / UNCC 431) TaxID=512565 RepID=I0HDM5_ACTM4|nr:hypothetical protein [Actinoplanes missouriensis]BAL91112.1 hypothetical protein AMIS_58920 [Actinoplanes missouriensis 431]